MAHFQAPSTILTGKEEEHDETTQSNRPLSRISNPGRSENQRSCITSWRTATAHSARQCEMDHTITGWQRQGQRQGQRCTHTHITAVSYPAHLHFVCPPSQHFIFIFVVLHESIFRTTRKQINPRRTLCYHFLHDFIPPNLKTAA
jgi:hypothetical protein